MTYLQMAQAVYALSYFVRLALWYLRRNDENPKPWRQFAFSGKLQIAALTFALMIEVTKK